MSVVCVGMLHRLNVISKSIKKGKINVMVILLVWELLGNVFMVIKRPLQKKGTFAQKKGTFAQKKGTV
jgi:hypothetical protein